MVDITSSVVRLGNPAKAFNSGWTYAANIWDIQNFAGKLYFGVGNSSNSGTDSNAGPVPIPVYTPGGSFSNQGTSGGTIPQGQVDKLRVIGSNLVIPGHDPTGSDALLFYSSSGNGTWAQTTGGGSPTPNPKHVYDLIDFPAGGSTWFMAGGDGSTKNLMKSTDAGATWTNCTDTFLRMGEFFVLDGDLYCRAAFGTFIANDGVWKFTSGTTWTNVSPSDFATMLPGQTVTGSGDLRRATNFPDTGTVVYVGAQGVNDHQWDALAGNLYVMGTMGSPTRTLHPSQSGAKAYDIWTDGTTLAVLWAYASGGHTVVSVVTTTDLSTWTEQFTFTPNSVGSGSQGEAYARSFEILNGIYYFGLGMDFVSSGTPALANTGDVLVYNPTVSLSATIGGVSSVAAAVTPRKRLAAIMSGLSAVGFGLTSGAHMAGSFSDYTENKLLDLMFNGTAFTPPATYYAALYTAAPTDAGGGTQVSTGVWTNYARIAITKNTTNFPSASSGAVSNAVAIDFGTATISGTAPVVVALGLFDASSAGNLIAWADLTVSKTINNTDPVSIAIGDLDIILD